MTSNNQRKTGKQTYSVNDLYNLARYCVDNNISGNEARKKYFKNNPYQFVFFLRILEGLLNIVKMIQIINTRNLSYKNYIDSLKDLRDLFSYYNLLYEMAKRKFEKTILEVRKANAMFEKSADAHKLTGFKRMKFIAINKIHSTAFKQSFIDYAEQQDRLKKLNGSKKIINDIEKDMQKTIEKYDEFLLSTIIGLF